MSCGTGKLANWLADTAFKLTTQHPRTNHYEALAEMDAKDSAELTWEFEQLGQEMGTT